MLTPHLHAAGWNGPDFSEEIDLVPTSAAHLARSGSGQRGKCHRPASESTTRTDAGIPARSILHLNCRLIFRFFATLDAAGSSSFRFPFHRAGFRPCDVPPLLPTTVPLQCTTSKARGCFGLGQPEGVTCRVHRLAKNLQNVLNSDRLHRHLAQDGYCISPKRVSPLVAVLGVLEAVQLPRKTFVDSIRESEAAPARSDECGSRCLTFFDRIDTASDLVFDSRARSRACARETSGNPPSPISRRLPPTETRSSQVRPLFGVI